ncbi:phage scaffolding protein [Lysinibacillus fusiformis]|uniref:phage scaffolding protein n=1 Tax=Lysinibacillus fusiformis TaxID=28031 RepID=UPI002E234711|nr:phage scaffolding protein [Lysinibacillus fusiformis]MED4888593.1 phage scaffolding protein [Lysinibacillus fusiformis]
MKKEDLIALGLSEEQAQQVLDGFGTMVPKSRLDDKIKELKTANDTIAKYETDLEELKPKAAGNEKLLEQIQKLQDDNKTAKEQHDAELAETRLSSAMKLALSGKVQDIDIVLGQLDKTKIELDEQGNVKGGLDDQLTTLKESKSFLFVPETEEKPLLPKGTKPGEGRSIDEPTSIGAQFAQQANEQSKSTEKTPWD